MDDLEFTNSLEQELARLRVDLVCEDAAPLGLASRLEAGVLRASRDDTPVGWEPRVFVASLVYAVMSATTPSLALGRFSLLLAAVSLAYSWLASRPTTARSA